MNARRDFLKVVAAVGAMSRDAATHRMNCCGATSGQSVEKLGFIVNLKTQRTMTREQWESKPRCWERLAAFSFDLGWAGSACIAAAIAVLTYAVATALIDLLGG